MFFDLILLNPQHQGRFGNAWIAATLGIQQLKKDVVITIDVEKLCQELQSFVCSESSSPRSRFSLRLSSILINGVVKIQNKKAAYLLEELYKIITTISKPPTMPRSPKIIEITDIMETPPTPIIKTKSKRRRPSQEKETPQSVLEQITEKINQKLETLQLPELPAEDEVILEARADEITLREIQSRPQEEEHIGELGVLQQEDIAALEELGVHVLSLPSLRSPQPSLPLPLPPLPVTIRDSPSSPIQPSEKFVVEAQVHVSAQSEVPREEEPMEVDVVPPPEEQKAEAARAVPRRPLRELQADIVEKVAKVPKGKKKKPDDLSKVLVSTVKPKRIARINRGDVNDNLKASEWVMVHPCPKVEAKPRALNLTAMLNLLMVRPEAREARDVESPALRPSTAPAPTKSGVVTPTELSQEEEKRASAPPERMMEVEGRSMEEMEVVADVPVVTLTPVPATEEDMEQRTREETFAVAAEKIAVSPKKKRKLLSGEPEIVKESEMRSRELAVSAEMPQEIPSVEVLPVAETAVDRQQKICEKIARSGRENFTLEDLCPRPLNKLNVARTFGDLLVLCKHGYVNLVSEEESTELKYVERGPKLNR